MTPLYVLLLTLSASVAVESAMSSTVATIALSSATNATTSQSSSPTGVPTATSTAPAQPFVGAHWTGVSLLACYRSVLRVDVAIASSTPADVPSVRLDVEVAPPAVDEVCEAEYAWLELYAIGVTLAAVAFAGVALLLDHYIWSRRHYVCSARLTLTDRLHLNHLRALL